MTSNPEHADAGQRIVPMRLQKFLARAGAASRRGSENLMTAGRVKVNGEVVRELGSKVDPLVDVVEVDGIVVSLAAGPVTIVLNKPAGVITTMKAQSDKPIVADLVPLDKYPGLFPVGRLDSDTTGVLLFTTDGELGNALLHPRHHVPKTYLVGLDGALASDQIAQIEHGVELDDGPTQPADIQVVNASEAKACARTLRRSRQAMEVKGVNRAGKSMHIVRVTIREGRYHQVKRMFEAVGRTVVALHRESFGPVSLHGEKSGSWRVLESSEVEALHRMPEA